MSHCTYAEVQAAGMKSFIVTVTPPFPLVGSVRVELKAPSADFARAMAFRHVGIRGCTASVRELDTSSYAIDVVDSAMQALEA